MRDGRTDTVDYMMVDLMLRRASKQVPRGYNDAPSSVNRQTKSHSDLPIPSIDTKPCSLMVRVLAKHYGPTDGPTNQRTVGRSDGQTLI